MAPTLTKSIKVNFDDGLPIGTRGTFNLDGELWIAVPMQKYVDICTMIDKMLNTYARIADEMLTWVNRHPGDVDLITDIISRVKEMRRRHRELLHTHIRAKTKIMDSGNRRGRKTPSDTKESQRD